MNFDRYLNCAAVVELSSVSATEADTTQWEGVELYVTPSSVSTIHYGPRNSLSRKHELLRRYLDDQNFEILEPVVEEYMFNTTIDLHSERLQTRIVYYYD